MENFQQTGSSEGFTSPFPQKDKKVSPRPMDTPSGGQNYARNQKSTGKSSNKSKSPRQAKASKPSRNQFQHRRIMLEIQKCLFSDNKDKALALVGELSQLSRDQESALNARNLELALRKKDDNTALKNKISDLESFVNDILNNKIKSDAKKISEQHESKYQILFNKFVQVLNILNVQNSTYLLDQEDSQDVASGILRQILDSREAREHFGIENLLSSAESYHS
jgi:hypothetical protein